MARQGRFSTIRLVTSGSLDAVAPLRQAILSREVSERANAQDYSGVVVCMSKIWAGDDAVDSACRVFLGIVPEPNQESCQTKLLTRTVADMLKCEDQVDAIKSLIAATKDMKWCKTGPGARRRGACILCRLLGRRERSLKWRSALS